MEMLLRCSRWWWLLTQVKAQAHIQILLLSKPLIESTQGFALGRDGERFWKLKSVFKSGEATTNEWGAEGV